MQLINTSIYDKEVQARTKAIAETEKTKREKRAKAEEAKVMRYAQGVHNVHATPVAGPSGVATQPSSSYQIYIHDTPFQVVRGGSKLIRQSSVYFLRIFYSSHTDFIRRPQKCKRDTEESGRWRCYLCSQQEREPPPSRRCGG